MSAPDPSAESSAPSPLAPPAPGRNEQAIARLVAIMDRLRDPGGCPWDREQTLRTLTPYLLEEANEVIEAIETGDHQNHREELGDLLFQVVFQARIAQEEGRFGFAEVCDAISDKLTRRHPHVFGAARVSGSAEVLKNWELIKAEERKARGDRPRSAIGGVPLGLPALVRAERITDKASAVGFDWSRAEEVLAKVREELAELTAELQPASGAPPDRARVEAELGDLLFSVANLGRFLKIHPEEALRGTVRRFESRFHHLEARLAEVGRKPADSTLAEMEVFWQEAHDFERAQPATESAAK